MADRNDRQQAENEELRGLLTDFLRIFARFLAELGRLALRAMWALYRTIGRRRTQPERAADHAERKAGNAIEDMRGFFRRRTAAAPSDSDETHEEAAAEADAPRTGGYVEMTRDSDPEAAAMLEELLQQTAAQAHEQEAAAEEAVTEALPLNEAERRGRLSVEQDIDEPTFNGLQRSPVTLPASETDASADAPPITPIPDEERARIAAMVDEEESLSAGEQVAREHVSADEDARLDRMRAAMEADKARIRAEQQQRREAFERAEAERKQRQQARNDAVFGAASRLTDSAPAGSDEADDDSAGDVMAADDAD